LDRTSWSKQSRQDLEPGGGCATVGSTWRGSPSAPVASGQGNDVVAVGTTHVHCAFVPDGHHAWVAKIAREDTDGRSARDLELLNACLGGRRALSRSKIVPDELGRRPPSTSPAVPTSTRVTGRDRRTMPSG
jgi:hypothetical protein